MTRRDETGRALTLPFHGGAATLPLDATIVGAPGPAPSEPLPHISVSEPRQDEPAPAGDSPDLVVVGVLGEGGMGRVQLARQRSLQREVALKRPKAGATDWDAQLLRAEALLTGHLEHPNIIPVHALGTDSSGQPVIVMKRVEGVSWRDLLRDEQHPGWARREPDREARLVWHLQVLAQLCNAIAFAHSASLHELLSGQVRHRGDDLATVVVSALASAPFEYAPPVPAELAELANQATSADPAARPRGALAVRQALLDHLRHRSSLRLSASADRVLTAVEAGDPASAGQGLAIVECRFGYREALREWPDNPDALRGLRRCAVATVKLEIARRDPAAARAALAEVPEPPPELVAALGRLERSLAEEIAERDRLRRLAHDADPTVGAPARVLMFSMLLVVVASVVVYGVRLRRGGIGAEELIGFPALLAVSSLGFLFLYRRQLAVNAFNRRLTRWLTVLLLLLFANRVAGQANGAATSAQFASDAILLAGLFAAGAVFLFAWLWVCAAVMLVGALAATLLPHAAHIAFEIAAAISIVTSAALIPKRPPEP